MKDTTTATTTIKNEKHIDETEEQNIYMSFFYFISPALFLLCARVLYGYAHGI